MLFGKQAAQCEAPVPMAAGARLEAMRRRVCLSRVAVWTVIAAGPIALAVAVAVASTPGTVAQVPEARPPVTRTAAVVADPGGYAQLFLGAWLRSSADDATSARARLARSMAPEVDLPAPDPDAQPAVQSVTAMRSVRRGSGTWSVTVAAQYADGSVCYYVVPVAADRWGTSFTVTGNPGVVAGPARAKVAKSSYAVAVPEGDLSSAVGQFLAAYLAGAAEVDRYLAPGVKLLALAPAAGATVSVQEVLAVEEAAASEQVSADGTTVRVLAKVEARDATGRWPLAYELTLKARSGRWEVAALESGTAHAGGAQ
ncbi:conjugal transfer protein [Streptomyces griseofuscus]|uniref:conjugal transfer protein n=1 Tax=Streptomyces griseofuscus TaxID=146922 RepID=UPI0036FF669E